MCLNLLFEMPFLLVLLVERGFDPSVDPSSTLFTHSLEALPLRLKHFLRAVYTS